MVKAACTVTTGGWENTVRLCVPSLPTDHLAIKRVTRPMLGFKSFWAAQRTLAGIELMHMIRKGQLIGDAEHEHTPAEQFYALAA